MSVPRSLLFGLALTLVVSLAAAQEPGHAAEASTAARTKAHSASSGAKDITVIQHIVFIIKENRSFDNYFGAYPGANGATTGLTSYGAVVPLLPTPDYAYPFDPEHGWASGNEAIDGGKMDRFDLLADSNINGQGYLGYTQASQTQLPNYWTYAQNFVLADNAYSSIQSDSFTNHLYTVAAQDDGALFISGPTTGVQSGSFGCDAPVGRYFPVTIFKLWPTLCRVRASPGSSTLRRKGSGAITSQRWMRLTTSATVRYGRPTW